jgi:ribosomal protein L34E
MDDESDIPLEPLKITCGESRCDKDLHCFAPNRRKKTVDFSGACQGCGKQLVDFPRVRKRDPEDVNHTFSELQRELIRYVFFNAPFDEASLRKAQKLGLDEIKARIRKQLLQRVGKANHDIFRDGTQTPKGETALNFAQHATATCCRKCLEYWYSIPRDRPLTDAELDFCEGLILEYLARREDDLFPPTPDPDTDS